MNNSPNGSTAPNTASTSVPPNDHNFPESVLQRIFDLVIQGPVTFPPPIDDEHRILAQVCQRWRHVVTLTSTYWSSFDFTQLDVQHAESLFQLAQVFLLRSGSTTPLTIRFRGSLLSDVARKMFEFVIRSYAHRIWFLSCIITKRELKVSFGAGCGRFPLLQHIDIEVRGTDGQFARRILVKGSIDFSGFQHAPSLRHVSIRIPNGVHSADLRLPWSGLTRIDLGNTPMRPSKFLKILEQSFALKDGFFCINFALSYHGQSPIFRTIVIPLVRRLHLRLICPGKDARVLRELRMPSLESVWLEREEVGRSTRDMALYATILARWNAPLKHLTVAEHSFPRTSWFLPRSNRIPRFMMYQQLDGVFRSAHHLTSLYLCPGVFMHPLVLEKLASGDCLPFLEKLGISSISGWDVIWMALERNLASTRPASGPSFNSASFVAPVARPVALNYISLFVMGCGLDAGVIWRLKDALIRLRLSCGFAFQYADILSLESAIS